MCSFQLIFLFFLFFKSVNYLWWLLRLHWWVEPVMEAPYLSLVFKEHQALEFRSLASFYNIFINSWYVKFLSHHFFFIYQLSFTLSAFCKKACIIICNFNIFHVILCLCCSFTSIKFVFITCSKHGNNDVY